jgi:hypothetical protein
VKQLLVVNVVFVYLGLLTGLYKIYLLFFFSLYSVLFSVKRVYLKSINRIILSKLCLIYGFFFFTGLFSLFFILLEFNYVYSNVLNRYLIQNISLILVFFQVYLGFLLLQYVRYAELLKVFEIIIVFLLAISIYQLVAFNTGFSYIGLYVKDELSGLRPSSFSGEPKHFSVFLVLSLFFLKDLLWYSHKKQTKIIYLFAISSVFYMFLMTKSGNGYLSFVVLLVFVLFNKNIKIFTVGFIVIAGMLVLFMNGYEEVSLRPSHLAIFNAIKYGDVQLFSLLDDLIVLPIMAWVENPSFLFFGFGKGLMHFYASKFMEHATWLDGSTYIVGNIALISNVSNFGIIFSGTLLYYLNSVYVKLFKKSTNVVEKRLLNFLMYNFVIGFFIGGNTAIFFYGSIGGMLYLKSSNKEMTNENTYNMSSTFKSL